MLPIADYYANQLQELKAEKEYMAEFVEKEKPYWLSLRHPRDDEMQWDLWNYAPLAHYDIAMEQVREEMDDEVRTDGGGYSDLFNGKKQSKVYYWVDPDTGAALEHTSVGNEGTIPFFDSEESAEEYLEKRAEMGDKTDYEGLSLYQGRTRKVGDAVDVLTDQSGIEDFMPDGGREYPDQEDGLQIPNPQPERVWFWYNPSTDSIVQEEVEPYDVRGVFETEDDADRFLDWYADQYGVEDTSHLELYSADIEMEGYGRKHFVDDAPVDDEPPGQASFDDYA